jgi:hypothetical protein
MTLTLNSDARRLASTSLQSVVNRGMAVSNGLANFLAGVATPTELSAFIKEAESLRDIMATGDAGTVAQLDLEPQALTLLRAALSTERRSRAERIEDGQRHITSASVSRALDESLRPLNDLLEHPVLRRIVPRPMPTLADFVTPEGRKNFDPISSLAAEEKEPKIRILLSASLINSDLSIYRRAKVTAGSRPRLRDVSRSKRSPILNDLPDGTLQKITREMIAEFRLQIAIVENDRLTKQTRPTADVDALESLLGPRSL